jgi:hypothetical protein
MILFNGKKSVKSEKLIHLEDDEIFSSLADKEGTCLFLGKYTIKEMQAVLGKRNFFKDARRKGLWPLDYDLDSSEFPPLQKLRIYYKNKDPQNVIVDLKIREGLLHQKKTSDLPLPVPETKYLILEWLTLQNPKRKFSADTTPLPGQNHPGLNLGRKVLRLFVYLAHLNRDCGILAFPAYYHNALLFSRQFRFLDPEKEGEIFAIRETFPKVPFKDLAWIIHLNCLSEEEKGIYEWHAAEQVLPLSKNLKKYFDSSEYKENVKRFKREKRFSIDWEKYDLRSQEEKPQL